MSDQVNVRYFKRDKLVDWEDDENQELENLEVTFQIINGTRINLTKRSLRRHAYLLCGSTPWDGIANYELKAELLWLAANHRGIFRLIALSLHPHTKVYQDIVALAKEYGISI